MTERYDLAQMLAQPDQAPVFDAISGTVDTAAAIGLLRRCEEERQRSPDAYRRVRACAYAATLVRFRLQDDEALPHGEPVPAAAWSARLGRRFEEALEQLWGAIDRVGTGRFLLSELGATYHALQYDELARLVRASMRESRGNAWLFRSGSLWEYPIRLGRALTTADPATGLYPVLEERTPVRLDLSHSGWSDIFFLAMEAPEGARVVNISVDLQVQDDSPAAAGPPRPPITSCLRVIDEPVLRLTAVDLGATVDCHRLEQVFDYAADHCGLLKAGLVASGIVPPALDGTRQSLAHLLRVLVGPGKGLELATRVDRIPKGSRLAVSTNLLASIITCCMRATGQTRSLEGGLDEAERRVVASRAILGEWLGGSGGGWQDSGGIWPGIKTIEGERAGPGDVEHGRSAGCLLPRHRTLELEPGARERLERSLVVFHGGMAGNVGPVLELVTSKHLVGWQHARRAREALQAAFPAVVEALRQGNARRLGQLTQAAFQGPLRAIIPAVSNAFTDALIARAEAVYGDGFWGFVMLGGMSGGGMAILVDPAIRDRVEASWPGILRETAATYRDALPFVIEPVACRVAINDRGTWARLRQGPAARLPADYYHIHGPLLARLRHDELAPQRREDLLNHLAHDGEAGEDQGQLLQAMVVNLLPAAPRGGELAGAGELAELRRRHGFDPERQALLQQQLKNGRISLHRNRLPGHAVVEEVPAELVQPPGGSGPADLGRARELLAAGGVATVCLAGGVGSRWSGGGGVVKGLSPFVELAGRWRSFLELHLRKAARLGRELGQPLPVAVTTGFLTDAAIARALEQWQQDEPELVRHVHRSTGMLVNQRVVPTVRDLRAWLLEQPRPRLDERAERARADRDRAWMAWAEAEGEATAYTRNRPDQVLNPPGHWWELPSLVANGTLARLLAEHPALEHLLVHNVDTLGVQPTAEHLAGHLAGGATLTVELIERLSGDIGGSLAQVDGSPRLLEGLAIPDERLELGLRWYNSNTTWVAIDPFLALFGLDRARLADPDACRRAVLRCAERLPTYVTLKEVQRSWGRGQVDVFPVAQFEQLWGDMTGLPDCETAWMAVDRSRGQQLKDVGQLPFWHLDGSRDLVAGLAGLR